jgi:hypothetical protein
MRQAPQWGGDPLQRDKFAQNSIEIPRYAQIERGFSGQAQTVVTQFQSGSIDRATAMNRFREHLQEAETAAFVAGRRSRGHASMEITDAEASMLAGRHSRNMRYFSGFLDDVEDGAGRMPYGKRADLYAKSLWSLYTRGETTDWEEPENVAARYYWIMDPDAEHCRDCIERAKHSRDNDGYSWDELVEIGWPGENTVCMVNCRCHVQTVKRKVLVPVEDRMPAETPEQGTEEFIEMLGGPGLKVRMPAAGVPSVGLTPELLVQLFRGFNSPEETTQAAMLLPTVPGVLAKPSLILPYGDDSRLYIGNGMTLRTDRRDDGLWYLVSLFLGIPMIGGFINPHFGGGINLADLLETPTGAYCR